MKATVFVNTSKIYGGIEKNLFIRAFQLQSQGQEIYLVTGSQKIYNLALERKIDHVFLIPCRGDYDLVFFFKLWIFLRKVKAQVVFLSTKKDYWRGGLVAKLYGAERIIAHWGSNYAFKTKFKRDLIFGKILDFLIVNSKELALLFRNKNFPLADHKIKVIYNGLELVKENELSRVCLRDRFNIPNHAIILGSAGRLVQAKCFETGIKLVSELVDKGIDLYFVLSGDGPYADNLLNYAREFNVLDRILFLGDWKELHKSTFYQELDIFLFFAGKNEGLPNVLLEALSQNTMVVSSPTTSIHEIIPNRTMGRIVKDYEELKLNVLEIINTKSFHKDTSRRSFIASAFAIETMVNETRKVFYE